MTTLTNWLEVVLRNATSRRAGVIVSYIYSVVQIIVQLLYVPILLRGIGQSEYGLYQFVGSIMSYLTIINTVLAAGVSKYYSKAFVEGDKTLMENTLAIAKRLYWVISLIAVIIIGIVCGVVVHAYTNSFTPAQLNEMSLMFAILAADMVVVMNNTISIAAITANERFVFLRLTQLMTAVVQPVLVIVFLKIWPSAVLVTAMTFTANLICAILQRIFSQGVLKTRYTFHFFDKQLAQELLLFSSTVVLVSLSDQIFWKSGQLILGFFYGADTIAVFSVGSQIYSVYMVLGTTVASVFLPLVTDLTLNSRHKERELSHLFIKVGRISFYVSFLVLAGFFIFGDEFIRLWAGDAYGDSYFVALLVMAPFTIDVIQNLGLTILQVVDKYQFRGYMNMCIAIVNVLVSVPLGQRFGCVGVACATAFSIFIGNGIFMNMYYEKAIGLDVATFWREIFGIGFPLAIYGIITFLIWRSLSLHGWFPLIIAGSIFVVFYCLVALLFCFNEEEKNMTVNRLRIINR
jgi:O-antigen/teichoic acid export membrane protein